VHRIGRTGRAGREGHAILFVAPRERRLLHAIEKATNTKIEPMQLPTVEELNTQRVARFQQKLDETLTEDLSAYENLIESYLHQNEANPLAVAAALAKIAQGDEPLFLKEQKVQEQVGFDNSPRRERSKGKRREPEIIDDVPMDFYRIDVGRNNDVKPGNIVGAIANEAGLDSKYIGRIEIFDNHSTLSLPAEMPREVYMHLKNVYVAGKKMNLNLLNDKNESNTKSRKKPGQKTAKPSERKPRHKKRNRKPRK
jgi:ATP-dependent RNA helicase DeaD